MARLVSDAPLPPVYYIGPRADDNYEEVKIHQDAKPPSESKRFFYEMETQVEKQISVDPLSLKESLPSSAVAREPTANSQRFILPSLALKPRFISCSLPSSATSTPKVGTTLKKKWRCESHASPTLVDALERQDSAAFSFLGSWRHDHLQISNLGGEKRASMEFDDVDLISSILSSSKFEFRPSLDSPRVDANSCYPLKAHANKDIRRDVKRSYPSKCCWYLPNFVKGKPVRGKSDENLRHIISRTVSLQKFECGSWSDSSIIKESESSFSNSKNYFDLPLELIRSVNDTVSPIRSAFYFHSNTPKVSQHTGSTRKSNESSSSSRHVRSRSSSSSCRPPPITISPRLRKARDDFNALLDAQRL